MERKLTTLLVNETEHDLLMKVENRNSFVPLAEVKRGCHHALRLCVNWAFQEFPLEVQELGDAEKKLFVNSDECCDFESITIKESEGQLVVERVARQLAKRREPTSKWKWTCPRRFWLWLGWGTFSS